MKNSQSSLLLVLVGVLVAVQTGPVSVWTPLLVVFFTVVAADRVRSGDRSSPTQYHLPGAVAVAVAALPGAGLMSWIETDSLRLTTQTVLPAVGLACFVLLNPAFPRFHGRMTGAALVAASALTVAFHDDAIGRVAFGQPGAPLVSLTAMVLLVAIAAGKSRLDSSATTP